MKLLVSAYACEPGKGSEPAVGWNWVQALLRRGYQLHVLTRSNNRESIEASGAHRNPAVAFHYYDLPAWMRAWKRRPGGIYFYYLFWQWGARTVARRLHARERFDRVQHVTFASYRQPSFMGGLGIPFIFGPVGGGESMPASLRKSLPLRSKVAEAVRNAGNRLIALDPFMRHTFAKAEMIACTTEETMARIPAAWRGKCVVQPAIGIDASEIVTPSSSEPVPPQFLFIGRLLYWKGLHLAFRALARVRPALPNVRLKIIGTGEDRAWLEGQARAAGVTDLLEWVASTPHDQVAREYRQSLAFLFPSLHDSGGLVVLESLAAGLPVICLDLGGPGAMATAECAIVVGARHADEEIAIQGLADAMTRIAGDAAFRAALSVGAVNRARQLTWDRGAAHLYGRLDRDSSKPDQM